MAFDRKRFLGLTVIEFSSSVGWNDEGSSLRVKMAPEDGESISSYTIGDILDFQMGSFTFTGFLERVIERHDGGGITFEAILSDGKEILRNVQCVVSNFYGTTIDDDCLVANYFNIFRHFERNGYGSANSNENGMDVRKFIQGANELSVKCGVISAGKKYQVNLSKLLEGLPDYYRIPGPTTGLLDAISTICDDIGKMWRLKLEGTTFNIETISLAQDAANQRVGDSIRQKSSDKKVIAWDSGVEAANGVVANFVVWGGTKENSIQFNKTSPTDAVIKYFWGYDINGVPQYSINYELKPIYNKLGQSASYEVMNVDLPATGIEDIAGGILYKTDTLELMMVMGSQEAWELYLELYDQPRYQSIFLRGPRDWNADTFYWMAYGGAGAVPLKREFSEKENDVGVRRAARLFSFLKSYCENYWGKQFLVQVNSGPESNLKGLGNMLYGDGAVEKVGGLTVRNKLERKLPEDQLVDPKEGTYNIIPTSSGWLDPSYNITAIPKEIYEGQFKDANGKIFNWFVFNIQPGNYQIDDTSPDSYVSGNYVYIKANVSETYVKISGTEHVHVSLPQTPFFIGPEASRSELGNDQLSRFLFGIFGPLLIGSSDLFKVGYAPVTPWNALIAFRSNTNDVYGPWYINSQKGGLTKVENDASLTPWIFGSGANLAEVFSKKLKDINPIDKFETGSLTMVSLPEMALGEELSSNGAIVTSINATYGTSGVTTQYTFRTFTPRFGLTSRFVIERLRRQAAKQNEDRRNILKAYMDTIARQQASYRSEMGSKIRSFFLDFLGRRHDRMSPHALIVMGMGMANAGPGAAGGAGQYIRTKTLGATYKYNESLKDIGKKLYEFIDQDTKSAASIDTIFCPFRNSVFQGFLPSIQNIAFNQVKQQSFTNILDPSYNRGDGIIDPRQGKVPTALTYNPYKIFNHFDTLLKPDRDGYDNHNKPNDYNVTSGGVGASVIDVKAIALRGPLMISGWGIDLWTGQIIPNSDYGLTNRFNAGSVQATAPWEGSEKKLAGPVDLIWDSGRGVWTSHDVVRIKPAGDIPRTSPVGNTYGRISYGGAYLYTNDLVNPQIAQIYNLSSKPQKANRETLAFYSVFDNRWYIKGEGCEIRFWDEKTANPPEATQPVWSDFKVTEGIADPYRIEDAEGNLNPEHFCVDLIQTDGSDDIVDLVYGLKSCPGGTVIARIKKFYFWHGLLKEFETLVDPECPPATTTPDPNSTTTPDPNSTTVPPVTTTTVAPTGCYLAFSTETGCYYCSQNPKSEDGGTNNPSYSDCDSCQQDARTNNLDLPSCNGESVCLIETEPGCYACLNCSDTQSPTFGSFTGANAAAECATAAQTRNLISCTTTTTTSTTLPPVYCYLTLGENNCWYCTANPPAGSETDPDIGGLDCDECGRIAADRNSELSCTQCYKVFDEETKCWYCTDDGAGAGYSTCEECNISADNDNYAPGSECALTTTSTTTSTTSTTLAPTTTSPPAGCVQVITSVGCNAETGEIEVTGTALVQACGTTQAPLVAQSNNFEVVLLRAEVKILTKKIISILNTLEEHNIKVK